MNGSQETSVPLCPDTAWLVDRFFRPEHRKQAVQMLIQQCARNLPFCQDATEKQLERLRFAAIKLSGGNLDRLSHAIREAQMDWRDLLMAAGFGLTVTAHREWFEELRANQP